jgi:DNA-binding IclR family transcriptional regulator
VLSPPNTSSPKLTPALADRLLTVLRQSDQPLTPRDLRQACHVRTRTLYQALAELVEGGTIVRDAAGYRLPPAPASSSSSSSSSATAAAPLQSNTGNGSGNA